MSSVKLTLIRCNGDQNPLKVTLPISADDLFSILRAEFPVGSLLIEQYFPGDNIPLAGRVLLDYPWDVEYTNEDNLENITVALYELYKGDAKALFNAFIQMFRWTNLQTMDYLTRILTPHYPLWNRG